MSYEKIAKTTLTSATATITFDSIPQNFRDLVVVLEARGSANTVARMRFNTSSTDYRVSGMLSTGNAPVTFDGSTTGIVSGTTTDTIRSTSFSPHIFHVFAYSTTNRRKAVMFRVGATSAEQVHVNVVGAGRWQNSSPITRIDIGADSGNMVAGSSATLYGIRA